MLKRREPAYVGLDLSLSSTGVCVLLNGEVKMDTIKTTTSTAEHDLARLEHIRDTILSILPHDIGMICVEDFFVPQSRMQMNAAKHLIMLGTVVRLSLLHAGLPFFIPTNSQLKKFITGKGTAPKDAVMMHVYKQYGIEPLDNNQGDACVLAHMAEAVVKHKGMELLKYQRTIVEEIIEKRQHYNVVM